MRCVCVGKRAGAAWRARGSPRKAVRRAARHSHRRPTRPSLSPSFPALQDAWILAQDEDSDLAANLRPLVAGGGRGPVATMLGARRGGEEGDDMARFAALTDSSEGSLGALFFGALFGYFFGVIALFLTLNAASSRRFKIGLMLGALLNFVSAADAAGAGGGGAGGGGGGAPGGGAGSTAAEEAARNDSPWAAAAQAAAAPLVAVRHRALRGRRA
jgi:hypothetical protein